jgi:chemotaxis protein methyltransferase CheR
VDGQQVDREYYYFMTKIKKLTGIDLGQYKSSQMQRRLKSLLNRSGMRNFVEYYKLLERDRQALQSFLDFITINVSEFFRNPDKFEELKTNILPGLLARQDEVRIWSAGCAHGAEPYSVAIIMDELASSKPYSIWATDIDASILEKAKQGVYRDVDVKNVSRQRLINYFTYDREASTYTVEPSIRERVVFEVHDLLKDPFPQDMDLILCRNVVIYFTDEAKAVLYERFYESLREGGVLFVGGTEMVFGASSIGFESISPLFYRKPIGGGQPLKPGRATSPAK